MVRIIMEHLKGYTTVDLAVKANDEVSDFLSGKVDETVNRLLADTIHLFRSLFLRNEIKGHSCRSDPSPGD